MNAAIEKRSRRMAGVAARAQLFGLAPRDPCALGHPRIRSA